MGSEFSDATPLHDEGSPPGAPSTVHQFKALLYKNNLLQVRSQVELFGLRCGGIAVLVVQVGIPVVFIAIMCLVSQLRTLPLPAMTAKEWPLSDSAWAGTQTLQKDPVLLLSPDTPEVRRISELLATALVCDGSRTHPDGVENAFSRLWRQDLPPNCESEAHCIAHRNCTAHVRASQLAWAPHRAAVDAALRRRPGAYAAAVEFDAVDTLSYTLRMNHTQLPPTNRLFSDINVGSLQVTGEPDTDWKKYFFGANLQLAVDRSLAALRLGIEDQGPLDIQVHVKAFPWPSHELNVGGVLAGILFNFLLVFAFLLPTCAIVGVIVHERELQLRGYMRVLGLLDAAYWGSWFVTHMASLCFTGLLCAVIGMMPFSSSSLSIMVAFYWAMAAALVASAYAMSTLFARAQLASLFCPFIYALSMIPAFLVVFGQPGGGLAWYLVCLLPQSAMSLFAFTLISWESSGLGITRRTLFRSVAPSYFSAASVIGMLLLDAVLYSTITLLVDRATGAEPLGAAALIGVRRAYAKARAAWLRSRWRGPPSRLIFPQASNDNIAESSRSMSSASSPRRPLTPPQHVAIRAEELTKLFSTPTGVRAAVDRLSLDVYDGQVTALLGPNGAGKSTVMTLLTGMLAPTSGVGIVDGFDITRDMGRVRQSLGVCPQFDILWPVLTVQEHLRLYAALRGYGRARAAAAATSAAEQVSLLDKIHCPAAALSGGQKRRLSVAIAFLGSPRVVLLDEPTSGMDPAGRRFTWDLISRHKHCRAIVLSTHSMHEADALCERIVILAHGRVAAEGSALALKEEYGVGYTLKVLLDTATVTGRLAHGLSGFSPTCSLERSWPSGGRSAGPVGEGHVRPDAQRGQRRRRHAALEAVQCGASIEQRPVGVCGSATRHRSKRRTSEPAFELQTQAARHASCAQRRRATLRAGATCEGQDAATSDEGGSGRTVGRGLSIRDRIRLLEASGARMSCSVSPKRRRLSRSQRTPRGAPAQRMPPPSGPFISPIVARDGEPPLSAEERYIWQRALRGVRAPLTPAAVAAQRAPTPRLTTPRNDREARALLRSLPAAHAGHDTTQPRMVFAATGAAAARPAARRPSRSPAQAQAEGVSGGGGDDDYDDDDVSNDTPPLQAPGAVEVWPPHEERGQEGATVHSRRQPQAWRPEASQEVPRLNLSRRRERFSAVLAHRRLSLLSNDSVPASHQTRSTRSGIESFGMHTAHSSDNEEALGQPPLSPNPAPVSTSQRRPPTRRGRDAAVAAAAAPPPPPPSHRAREPDAAPDVATAQPQASHSAARPAPATRRSGSAPAAAAVGDSLGLATDSGMPFGSVIRSGGTTDRSGMSIRHTPRPSPSDAALGDSFGRRGDGDTAAAREAVQRLVCDTIPDAELVSQAGEEMSFHIPKDNVTEFPDLLRTIEEDKAELRVRSYGVSMTTLEDVFLRIAAADSSPPLLPPDFHPSSPPAPQAALEPSFAPQTPTGRLGRLVQRHTDSPGPPRQPLSPILPPDLTQAPPFLDPHECPRNRGLRLWLQQFGACTQRHRRTVLREPWAIVTQLTVPLLLVAAALLMGRHDTAVPVQPKLSLVPAATTPGWHSVLAGSEEARSQPLYGHVQHRLRACAPWEDTALDPAIAPLSPPDPDTLDGHIAQAWYGGEHVSHAFFAEVLHTHRHASLSSSQSIVASSTAAAQSAPTTASGGHSNAAAGNVPPAVRGGAPAVVKSSPDADRHTRSNRGLHSRLFKARDIAKSQLLFTQQPLIDDVTELDASGHAGVAALGAPRIVYTVLVNETAKHALPTAINSMSNAVLGSLSAGSGEPDVGRIRAAVDPFPIVFDEQRVRVPQHIAKMSVAVYTTLALVVLSASFVVVPVKELRTGSLHVQIVSGLNPTALWPAMLLTDIAFYVPPACLILVMLCSSGLHGVDWGLAPLLAAFLGLFGFASITQVFVLHSLFHDEMYALILVSFLSFSVGFLGYSCTYILDQIAAFSDEPSAVAHVLEALLRVASPTYLAFKLLFRVLSASKSESLWSWRVAGQSLAWLGLQGGIYLCLAVLRGVLWLGGGRRILVLTADHIAGALLFVLRPLWRGALWCYEQARSRLCPPSPPSAPSTPNTTPDLSAPLLDVYAALPTPQHPFSVRSTPFPPDALSRLTPSRSSQANPPSGTPTPRSPLPAQPASSSHLTPSATLTSDSSARRLLSFPSLARSDYGTSGEGATWTGRFQGPGATAFSGELREGAEGALAAVREHAALVRRSAPADFLVLLDGVQKRYGGGGAPAVEDVSLAVPEGHCFGLLGTNGAGKTTIFRMLTRETRPTRGAAYIAGRNLSRRGALARTHVGYCPQEGGLTLSLSARDILAHYAAIRGLPGDLAPAAVEHALARMRLREYADQPSGQLSGGNRRRLSVAVALIGAPLVLLLDEPTTGMDPAARKGLVRALDDARKAGHTVVLTSHSMEEADAFCTRVGILVQGALRCVGAPVDLKAALCGGYVVEARVGSEGRGRAFAAALRAALPAADVAVTSGDEADVAVVSVGGAALDVPRLFEAAEAAHAELGGTGYSVAQASLEHVFMQIAHGQGARGLEGAEGARGDGTSGLWS